MANDAKLSPRSKRKKRRWMEVLPLVVGGLLLVGVGWWAWPQWQTQRLIAALRAQGYPTNLAELAPKPVPPERNAGLIYQRLFLDTPGPKSALSDKGDLEQVHGPRW